MKGRVWIKICGIRKRQEAFWALEAGADAVGFVFAKSPRRITLEKAQALAADLPPEISKVGVFVNALQERVLDTALRCGLDYLQFHGDESPVYVNDFRRKGFKTIKAIPVHSEINPLECTRYGADAILLDTAYKNCRGGGGKTFNWERVSSFRVSGVSMILAGGLKEENIIKALETVRPSGVDTSSGVEGEKGKEKDKIMGFVRKIRFWEEQKERRGK